MQEFFEKCLKNNKLEFVGLCMPSKLGDTRQEPFCKNFFGGVQG